MNSKCNTCQKLQSNQTKCLICHLNFCSNQCQIDHLSKFHTKEQVSIIDKLFSKTKNNNSIFLKQGEFLKEAKAHLSIFDFNNFEFMKIGKKLNIIGRGAFGDVFLAKNTINKEFYAIKQMGKERMERQGVKFEFAIRESNLHRKLIHPNIIQLHSFHEDKENFYLIMDYMSKGSLYNKIKENKKFSEDEAFHYFIQTTSAINFLHMNNLIHRDIKPENLLIDNSDNIKLCDFGWCAEMNLGNRVTYCGTYEYMAPEIINEMPYNNSIDIWSLGILLYELLHGYSPFKASNGIENEAVEIFKNIKNNKIIINKDVSDKCQDLIKKLLSPDTSDRIKIKDIFFHPWVVSYENKQVEKTEQKITSSSNKDLLVKKKIDTNLDKNLKSRKSKFKTNDISGNNIKIDEKNQRISKIEESSIFDKVLKKVNEKKIDKNKANSKQSQNTNVDNKIKYLVKDELLNKKNQQMFNSNNNKKTEIITTEEIDLSERNTKSKISIAESNTKVQYKVENINRFLNSKNSNQKVPLVKPKDQAYKFVPNTEKNSLKKEMPIDLENLNGDNMKKEKFELNKFILPSELSRIKKTSSNDNLIQVNDKIRVKLTHSLSLDVTDDQKIKKKENDARITNEKKKELLNYVSHNILNKEKLDNIVITSKDAEDSESLWSKVSSFFNPFKCGSN